MTNLKAVIFDFDGVIANTYKLNYEVVKVFHPKMKEKEYRDLHNSNVYENPKTSTNTIPMESFDSEHNQRFKKEEHFFEPIFETITNLKKRFKLHVITSGGNNKITKYLESVDLKKNFESIMGRETHPSKVEKFKMLFKDYNLKPEECLFITDTLGDLKEAHKVNVKSLAVSWGFHSIEVLNDGNPHKILHKFEELLPEILIFAKEEVKIKYTNYKNETAIRKILPKELYFGKTPFHPKEEWLLKVHDVEKNAKRIYSLKDIQEWFVK